MKPPHSQEIIAPLVVFLLMGAIVNFAVAWGCILRRGFVSMTTQTRPESAAELAWLSSHGERASAIFGGTTVSTSLGFDQSHFLLFDTAFEQKTRKKISDDEGKSGSFIYHAPPFRAYRVRAGFPMRCLEHHHIVHTTDWTQAHPSEGASRRPGNPAFPAPDWNMATLPIWSGFVINTVFYAAILWLIFAALFALRRWRRIKRGLCPACAYPVGASNVCTECGRPVTKQKAQTQKAEMA